MKIICEYEINVETKKKGISIDDKHQHFDLGTLEVFDNDGGRIKLLHHLIKACTMEMDMVK